jgi:hypothetical protein
VSEIIKFHPLTKDIHLVVPPPKPAKFYLPKWYENSANVIASKKQYEFGELKNHSIKACMPLFDSMTSGYIQETWCDIHISRKDDGSVHYNYAMDPEIISVRSELQARNPDGYLPVEFVWRQPYGIETPSGWSIILTHPFNHTELPFLSMTAIVDSDRYSYFPFPNNYPFFIKEDFEGVIPAGSPMFQIIPFKRSNWSHRVTEFDYATNKKRSAVVTKFFQYGYKKVCWQRKTFK